MTRSVVLLTAAWCLSACQCGSIERGRYQCDPTVDAGTPLADQQCPGASRCGLEGYCHNNGDTSVAWRCHDRSNCENGWECGLSRDHAFRECHDPDAVDAGFPCEADTDCVRGFHCGVSQRCYDRTQQAPFPCRLDAGVDDCAPGWRCGLNAICHDTTLADAYPCEADPDCEQDWRCGLARVCLDPAVDALRPVDTTLGGAQKVNPLLLDHPPELLAASPVQNAAFDDPRQFIAYYDRGEISVLDLAVGRVPSIGTNPHRLQVLPDAGEVNAIATLGAVSLNLVAKRDVGSWTYVTRPDGGFEEVHFRTTAGPFGFDGNPTRPVMQSANGGIDVVDSLPHALRIGSTEDGYVPTLLGYDDRPLLFDNSLMRPYFYGWGGRSSAAFYLSVAAHYSDTAELGSAFSFKNNQILDFSVMTAHRETAQGVVDQTDCSVIADQRGLFVQQQTAFGSFIRYGSTPLVVPPFDNADCAADTGRPQNYRINRITGLGSSWLGITANALDAGVVLKNEQHVALIDVSNWFEVLDTSGSRYPFRGCLAFYDSRCKPSTAGNLVELPVTATTRLGPCKVCAGGDVVALSVVPSAAGQAALEVRCRFSSDAGVTDGVFAVTAASASGSACLRTPIPIASSLGTDPVELSRSNASQFAFAGPRGHLWVGRSSATAVPVFLDEAPFGALSDGAGGPVFLGPDRIGWYVGAPLGIVAFPLLPQDGDRPVAVLDGADGKSMVTASRSVVTLSGVTPGDPPLVLASPDGTPTRFDPPYHAVLTTRPGGAPVVVVTAGDVLLAANLGLPKPVLERRLVPAEGKSITALLALPRTGDAPTAVFALTNNALFKITSDTDQLWSSVQAPLPPGEPIELWADGKRGRIGYADGKVYSLETRVQIGASLFRRVDDFAQVCGQVYALAEGKLFRLAHTAAGGAVGQWQPSPIGGNLPEAELVRGTLLPFTEPDGKTTLYVFTRRGEAVRLPVLGCGGQ